MLAKVLVVISCLALVAFGEKEPWESGLELTAYGASLYFNVTGVSSNDEEVLPLDDCTNIESGCCQNFNELRQNAINGQINMELEASYVYMAMGAYFSREEPNHMGFAKFFYESSTEEREHALKLIEYQNKRGGTFRPTSILAPTTFEWDHALAAMKDALALEKRVNEALLRLHKAAENDPQMQDFLEANYLDEQVESIRELAGYVSQLKKLRHTNPGLGEHTFDREFLK